MSTGWSESVPRERSSWVRRPWLWVGAGLWCMVALTAVAAWKAHRAERQAAEEVRRAALAAATPDPQRTVITVPVNQRQAAGQVINIAELMARGAVEAGPLYDPQGVEDFAFTNCDGRTITKADLLGRPWAIAFVFTKCLGPCPTVTRQLKQLQDRLKAYDIRLVTLTVDPARDTPEVLKAYALQNGANLDRWYFLTGDQSAIYGLIHRSFRLPVQEVTGPMRQEGYEIIHSTNVMLVNADGVVLDKFNAAKDEEMVALRRRLQELAAPLSTAEDPLPVAGQTPDEPVAGQTPEEIQPPAASGL
uniref:SCO family protein n=1 Tax=Schlesneria paludicola TaxID=360056 RepID=A0A7C4LM43_9PLAN